MPTEDDILNGGSNQSTGNDIETLNELSYTIEADHPRNGPLQFQCLLGRKLRSAFSGTKSTPRNLKRDGHRSDDRVVPVDQMIMYGDHPALPGMRLTVYPDRCAYVISDPVEGDKKLLKQVEDWMRLKCAMSIRDGALEAEKRVEGVLDVDMFKTLCREMKRFVDDDEAKWVGIRMTDNDINDLPGEFLQNPFDDVGSTQPRYEKEMPAFVQNLNRMPA